MRSPNIETAHQRNQCYTHVCFPSMHHNIVAMSMVTCSDEIFKIFYKYFLDEMF